MTLPIRPSAGLPTPGAAGSPAPADQPPPQRRLGRTKDGAALYDMSERTFLRLADAGLIPWGIKLGSLRRWDLVELEAHIAAGCPRVRKGGR